MRRFVLRKRHDAIHLPIPEGPVFESASAGSNNFIDDKSLNRQKTDRTLATEDQLCVVIC